jgi:hypothetical protein
MWCNSTAYNGAHVTSSQLLSRVVEGEEAKDCKVHSFLMYTKLQCIFFAILHVCFITVMNPLLTKLISITPISVNKVSWYISFLLTQLIRI